MWNTITTYFAARIFDTMINYEEIGARIRAVRTRRDLTQEQLAEAIGVGSAHISHIETGNSKPSIQALVDIINALDCSADELLCLDSVYSS